LRKTVPAIGLAFLVLGAGGLWGDEDRQFGHWPYPEAEPSQLTVVDKQKPISLRHEAAKAFEQMKKAARKDKVRLVLLSGFRSVEYQKGLFRRAVKKHGSSRAAARWVAPAGHSEHHTGYAMDLGDGHRPNTNLEPAFESTKAFYWLQKNAAQYGFELAFPKKNDRGPRYEPWHWHYVGNEESRALFHRNKG